MHQGIGQRTAILLIGPNGSGKGTQQKVLKQKFGFDTFDMGATLRDRRRDGVLPLSVKKLMDQGKLIPDEVLYGLLSGHMQNTIHVSGMVLDGIPRTQEQAGVTLGILREHQFTNTLAVFFTGMTSEETVRRIRADKNRVGRTDNSEDVALWRFQDYQVNIEPALRNFFNRHPTVKVFDVPATQAVGKISDELMIIVRREHCGEYRSTPSLTTLPITA